MVVNAFLHTATLALFLWIVLRPLDPIGRALVLFFTLALFTIPFDWENTLAGFQSQFYLVFGFSILALKLYQSAEGFSFRWWAAIIFSVAAYFSMASGAMTVLAGLAAAALQILLGARERSRKEFAALVVLAAVLIVQLAFVRHVQAHDILKAKNFIEFLHAFLGTAAWPFPWIFAFVINIPGVALAARILRQRPNRASYDWLLLIMFLWIGAQWLTLAYGRAVAPTSSRYTDLLILGPILNIAAAYRLFGQSLKGLTLARNGALYRERDGKQLLHPAGTAAIMLVVAGIAAACLIDTFRDVEVMGARYAAQTANLRAFIQTGDMSHLKDKPYLEVPYPDPLRLASLAIDPTIRSLLVPSLSGEPLRTDLLLPGWLTHLFRGGAILLLDMGQLMAGVGIGLLLCQTAHLGSNGRPGSRKEGPRA